MASQLVSLSGSRIAGLSCCVPQRVVDNAGFIERFGEQAVRDVVKMIGVEQRRWVRDGQTTADLCIPAAGRLLGDLGWSSGSVDALICVTQTPDYRLPATAFSLHRRLALRPGVIAFDVNLGCSGYPYAIWLGMTMIATGAAKRVLLAVGDTVSRIVDPADRATAMLFGDAASVTALEADSAASPAFFALGSDGAGERNLVIPTGAFRLDDGMDERMAGRDPACLFMDGGEIFNFTLRSIPPLVAELMKFSGTDLPQAEAVLFHQANLFMLKHLSKKSGLQPAQVPTNIQSYGNTSSASIPLLMCSELQDKLVAKDMRLAMFGFGVGYSWAGAVLSVGPLASVSIVEG